MSYKFKFLVTLLISVLLIGCTQDAEMQNIEKTQNEIKEDLVSDVDEKSKLVERFEKKFPDATLYDNTIFDIDKDNSKELIAIYDTPLKKVNIALVNANGVKGVTIGEGNGYSFDYVKDSLKVDESTNYIVITLREEAQKLTVDFKITAEYNNEKKETTFIIESFNERRD